MEKQYEIEVNAEKERQEIREQFLTIPYLRAIARAYPYSQVLITIVDGRVDDVKIQRGVKMKETT